jgi:hypothetical protein
LERGVVAMLVLLADELLLGVPAAELALVAVALVALAADDVVVVAEAGPDEDEWLEPPQAPSSTVIGSSRRNRTPRLTVFRIDVDYFREMRFFHADSRSTAEAAQQSAVDTRAMIALALTGGVLMVHDWNDRSFWFEFRRGTQP